MRCKARKCVGWLDMGVLEMSDNSEVLWIDAVDALVDAAFETVSRNPSDHEQAVAYRRAIVAALQSRPAQINVGIDWRPIETAPKDGSTFITYSPPFREGEDPDIDTAGYIIAEDEFWKCGCGFQYVTHWTPMVRPVVGERA